VRLDRLAVDRERHACARPGDQPLEQPRHASSFCFDRG
jgi:hypothetical protein